VPKCRWCGKQIDKENAFQAPTGGGKFYYCNEEEYNLKIFEKQKKEEEAKRIKEEEKQRKLEETKRAYEKEMQRKKEKQKIIEKEGNKNPNIVDPVYEIVANIFGYRINNPALFREMKMWRYICDDDKKILAYLQENKDRLEKAIKWLEGQEYPRIRYFSAILKNDLPNYNKQIDPEPVKIQVDCEIYQPVISSKKKRRGLSALEDEV